MSFLIAIFARWGVAERFRRPLGYLAAAIALLALLWLLKAIYDHHVISDHEATIERQVEKKAREGGDAARGAVDQVRNETEAGNEEARNAAAGSDDPLRSGLDSLRRGAGADRHPAR